MCRDATDVGAMEEQQKRMKDLANRFWSKTDEERAFIKQTFDTWHVDASKSLGGGGRERVCLLWGYV